MAPWLDLFWVPREQNVLADALTNDDYSAFDLKNRIPVEWPCKGLPVLSQFLKEGEVMYRQIEMIKENPDSRNNQRAKRTPNSERLRVTDPW